MLRKTTETIAKKKLGFRHATTFHIDKSLTRFKTEIKLALAELRENVTTANSLPIYQYGNSDPSKDFLRLDHGLKHLTILPDLHSNDIRVYYIEYDDEIVVLEVATHRHFRSNPVGKYLFGSHHVFLAADEKAKLTLSVPKFHPSSLAIAVANLKKPK
jgi:hypothetical protein